MLVYMTRAFHKNQGVLKLLGRINMVETIPNSLLKSLTEKFIMSLLKH